jgi:addiction module HigA family antidote
MPSSKGIDSQNTGAVIASAAKQSIFLFSRVQKDGLLRRFAPRNDGFGRSAALLDRRQLVMKDTQMHNPAHPGEVVRELCVVPLKLTLSDAAKALDVARSTLSNFLNGKRDLSPEMALKLEMAFGGSAEAWLRMQTQYNIWKMRQNAGDVRVNEVFVRPIAA